MAFDQVSRLFIGFIPHLGKIFFTWRGGIFKVVDGAKGSFDQKGGRAEVEGVAGAIQILFYFRDGNPLLGGLFQNGMGKEAGWGVFPEELIDVGERFLFFHYDQDRLFMQEVALDDLDQAGGLGMRALDLEKDDAGRSCFIRRVHCPPVQ